MRFSWIGLLLLAGCSRTEDRKLQRVVLLPIENLTANAAGDVEAQALRLGVWESLQTQGKVFATMAGHRRDLPGYGPAYVVDGYLTASGVALRVNEAPVRCAGKVEDCLGAVAGEIAAKVGAQARAMPKAATLRAIASGEGLEAATGADPQFAGVWLAWSGQVAAKDGAGAALAVLEKAPLAGMAPYEAERVRARLAEFRQDRPGFRKALIAMAGLAPADVELQERAAREAEAGRDYAAAAVIYERLLAIARQPAVLNQMAYIATYTDDRGKAEGYANEAVGMAPNDATFADTRGDVAYWFGDYGTASQWYEKSTALNVTVQGGVGLWKAAEAARKAGDKARAEAMLQRYLDFRAKGGMRNPLLVQAVWEWSGEEQAAAVAKLRTAVQTTERGKALLFLGLVALNRRDFAEAERVRREMEPNSIESAFLRTLTAGEEPPPSGAFVPEALRALHLFLKGDLAGARGAMAVARPKMDPGGVGQWRRLDALLEGKQGVGAFPASPDDWLAVLLR